MAHLLGLEGALGGRQFALDASFLVGRGPYNHAVLEDARISRQHAKIAPEASGHVLYDLNSANGTYVNETAVKRRALQHGDVVRFGPFRFRFVEEGGPASRRSYRPRKVEELTRPGFDAPTRILDYRDATGAELPTELGLTALEDAERKLRTLQAFLQAVSHTLDEAELEERILTHLLDAFPTAHTAVVYVPTDDGEFLARGLRSRRGDGYVAPPLALPMVEEAVGKGRAVLSSPLAVALTSDASKQGTLMHAPMIYGGRVRGVVHVRGDGSNGVFTQADLELLTGVAAHAAMALQAVEMHRESLERERLNRDLKLAEQIQKSFLPSALPEVNGIRFVSEYRPAYSVGGDFYDVFVVGSDRIAMFIGDVSGKGVSAALLMARVSSDLRAAAQSHADPKTILERANELLVAKNQPDLFVTATVLVLDTRTRKLLLSSAGHLPPYLRRLGADRAASIDGGIGVPLGLLDAPSYEQIELTLAPGDALVLCTDGVLEATRADGEQFGFDRLAASLSSTDIEPEAIADGLMGDLATFVGLAPQYDDLTLLLCAVARPPETPDA